MISENRGIVYELFQEKDLEETISLIAEDFSRAEPLTKSLGITEQEFRYAAEIYCIKALREGLSVVAKDNGKIIGFMISEDLDSDPPQGIENMHEKFKPITELLNNLEKVYKKSYRPDKGHILHLFMGGVDKQHEKKHIITTLINESMQLAKSKNFVGAIGEPTGLATQHILRDKLGFNEKAAIRYRDFIYNGRHVFETIQESPGCILMEKLWNAIE